MHVLLHALLDYSRVSSKAEPFVRVDLNELVRDVMDDLEVRITETGGDPDCFKGLPRKITRLTSTGATLGEVESTYDYTTPFPNTTFPRLKEVEERIFEGEAAPRTIRTVVDTHDPYGNVTRKTHLGDVDDPLDGRIEQTSYSQDTENWILSLPTQASVCAEANLTCAHTDPNRLVSTTHTYHPGTALLATKSLWLEENEAESPLYQYPDYEYGNPVRMIDPKGNETHTTYNSVSRTHPTQAVQWDPGHVNSLDLGSAAYNPRLGVAYSKTDANGDTTTLQYDKLGRFVKVTRPGDEGLANGIGHHRLLGS